MSKILENLNALNIIIPKVTSPAANYIAYRISQNTIYIAGQIPILNGKLPYTGKVGDKISESEGKEAAKLCGINILAVLNTALDNDLDRVSKCLKIGVFINAIQSFTNHPEVANGISDLMVAVFGDKGKHSRFAIGAASLPRNASVEADAIFEIS